MLGKNSKIIVIVYVVLLIVFVWGFSEYIYKPQGKDLKKIKNRFVMAAFELTKAQKDARNLKELEKDLREIQEELVYVKERLPQEKQISALLQQLAEEADRARIDFISILPQKEIEEEGFMKMPVEIVLRCGYYNLTNYLKRIENLPRLVEIEGIEIRTKGDLAPRLEVKLKVNTFSLKEEGIKKKRTTAQKGEASFIYEKDPFLSLGKEKQRLTSELLTLTLTGILWEGKEASAIINDDIVKEGDFIGEKKVLKIRKDEVVLGEGEEKYILKLEE